MHKPFGPGEVRAAATAVLLAAVVASAVGCGENDAPRELHDPRLADIVALQEDGKLAETIDPLRAILEASPDDAEASYRLGVALTRTGRPSRAVWPLLKASASAERGVEAGLLLASVMLSSRNVEEAVRAADRVLEIEPGSLDAHRIRATAHLSAGNHAEALVDSEHILAAAPRDPHGLALRGAALAGSDRLDEAEVAFLALRDATREAENEDVAARGCVGVVSFYADNRKDPSRAEEALTVCAGRYRTNAVVLTAASVLYDRQDRPDDATRLWRAAAARAPDDLLIQSTLAGRLEKAGELQEAEAVLLEAAQRIGGAAIWQVLADFHRRRGSPEAARLALEKALADAGTRAELLRFTQADLLVETGDLEQAEDVAESLGDPGLRELMRARILAARGEDREALAAFDAGIPRWPNNPGARLLAGHAAQRLGDFDRALSEFRAAVRSGRRETDAALVAARLYHDLGEYDAALEFARIHLRSREEPGPEAVVLAARAATALGRFGAARKVLDRLDEMEGREVLALVERARVEGAASGAQAAVEMLRSAEMDLSEARNERVLRSLVENLLAAGEGSRALAEVDAVTAAGPGSASHHDLRGRALARIERLDEARAEFERALESDPDFAPALAGLATLRARAGDPHAAIALFDRAAVADPPGIEHRYHAAQLMLAAGRPDEARARLERLLEEFPAHARACNDLAWLLAEQGDDLDRALELAERAARLDRSANALDTLGWVRLKRGDAAGARRAFEEALEKDPDAPGVRKHLGLAPKPTEE